MNPLKAHIAVDIPRETIKPSPGKLRAEKQGRRTKERRICEEDDDDCKEIMTWVLKTMTVPAGSVMLTVIPLKCRH